MTATDYGVVLVTVPTQLLAETIARTLIQANLAAGISFFPVNSIYTWQGQVHENDEWQLVIKSELSKFVALETKIRAIHPYDVPEIIALPIAAGSQPYLDWISAHVKEDHADS